MREDEAGPAGSRVRAQTEDGTSNQSGPNWSDLAGQEQTWQVLDRLKQVADRSGRTVAQVATR